MRASDSLPLLRQHSSHVVPQVSSISKLVYDLKFTRNGVKRWVIRYRHRANPVPAMQEELSTPTSYPTHQKTGHALASWAVYQHVALRLSFDDIALSINDIFGYSLQ